MIARIDNKRVVRYPKLAQLVKYHADGVVLIEKARCLTGTITFGGAASSATGAAANYLIIVLHD